MIGGGRRRPRARRASDAAAPAAAAAAPTPGPVARSDANETRTSLPRSGCDGWASSTTTTGRSRPRQRRRRGPLVGARPSYSPEPISGDSESDLDSPAFPQRRIAGPSPYVRQVFGGDEELKYGQWVFAHLLQQELAALDPPISIEPRDLLGAEGEQEVERIPPEYLLAWTRARGRWDLFGLINDQWGPLSNSALDFGGWQREAFGAADDQRRPWIWSAWDDSIVRAGDRYSSPVQLDVWVTDQTVRQRIAEFERAVMLRLRPLAGERPTVSQEDYARAVAAQRAEDRGAVAEQLRLERGDPPNPFVRGPAPPNWSYGGDCCALAAPGAGGWTRRFRSNADLVGTEGQEPAELNQTDFCWRGRAPAVAGAVWRDGPRVGTALTIAGTPRTSAAGGGTPPLARRR